MVTGRTGLTIIINQSYLIVAHKPEDVLARDYILPNAIELFARAGLRINGGTYILVNSQC